MLPLIWRNRASCSTYGSKYTRQLNHGADGVPAHGGLPLANPQVVMFWVWAAYPGGSRP